MRKLKLISLLMAMALSVQTSVFAAATVDDATQDNATKSVTVQPRGVYLQGGGCTIAPSKTYVMMSGSTDSYLNYQR